MLAILPLAGTSGLLAWRDYENEVGQSAARVQARMVAFLASQRAALVSSERSLATLRLQVRPDQPARCGGLLDFAASVDPARYLSLAVLGPSGAVLCRASGLPLPAVGTSPDAPPDGTVGLFPAKPEAGALAIPAAVALSAAPAARLVAGLRLAAPADETDTRLVGTWLVDPGEPALVLAPSREALPARSTLDRLFVRGGPIMVAGRAGGSRPVFVAGRLPGGTRIVMGDSATDREARAASLLVTRIVLIASLLAAGVAVVAIGAHVTVAAPVQILTRRVDDWRTAGRFDDRPLPFVPFELAALVDAFGTATRALAQRGAELERARAEQELAFKEIHHRVKNNLQIIASLLNLQANRIRLPEAKAEFQSARDRVRALATLHRHLYAESGLHTVALRSFLLELCGQLFQAMGEREGQRIRLEVDAPELQMTSDQAVPLALIVTEAVSNAVKYAFPGGRTGSVSVRLRRLDADRIDLAIQDDGVGIPAGRAETDTGVRDGLGIQLIRGFAKQLGATLTVTEGNGTRYHVELALRRAAPQERTPEPA